MTTMAASGVAPAATALTELLSRRVAADPDGVALRFSSAGRLVALRWGQLGQAARRIGALLLAEGVGQGDCVLIWSGDRPEWRIAELGALSIGATVLPLAPGAGSSSALAAERAGLRIAAAIVEGAERMRALGSPAQAPRPPLVVVVPTADEEAAAVLAGSPVDAAAELGTRTPGAALDWSEALRRGEVAATTRAAELVERGAAIAADHPALVVPAPDDDLGEALIVTHGNLAAAAAALGAVLPVDPGDEVLCALSPADPAARVLSEFLSLTAGTVTRTAGDGVPASAPAEAGPRVLAGSTGLWTRLALQLRSSVETGRGPLDRLRRRRLRGRRATPTAGRRGPEGRLDRLLLAPLRVACGIGDARLLVSVGAPLAGEVRRLLGALGVRVVELVGSPATTACLTLDGVAMPGVELEPREDGGLVAHGDVLVLRRVDGSAVEVDVAALLGATPQPTHVDERSLDGDHTTLPHG